MDIYERDQPGMLTDWIGENDVNSEFSESGSRIHYQFEEIALFY